MLLNFPLAKERLYAFRAIGVGTLPNPEIKILQTPHAPCGKQRLMTGLRIFFQHLLPPYKPHDHQDLVLQIDLQDSLCRKSVF